MSNALKKITSEAKRIRKKKPGISWKTAVKQAGAKYRKGSIGQASHGKSKSVGRVSAGKSKGKAKPRSKKTLSTSIAQTRSLLTLEIGKLTTQQMTAAKKTDRKTIGKKLNEKKKLFKALSH